MARTKPIARHLIVSVYESDIKTGKKGTELGRIKLFMLGQEADTDIETWVAGVMKQSTWTKPMKRTQEDHRPKAKESVWHIVTKLLQKMNYGQIRVDPTRSVKGGRPPRGVPKRYAVEPDK